MFSPGDAVLFAVSSRRSVPWDAFKAAVDAAFFLGADVDADARVGMRYLRSEAASHGDALGHWDIVDSGSGGRHVYVAPPVLARLPWPGPPRAVLCGARSPDTAAEIRARSSKLGVSFGDTAQTANHAYAAARIELEATDVDALAEAAALVGVRYAVVPPAWELAMLPGSVPDYLDSLAWQPDDGLDWPRVDFDPRRLAFGPGRGDPAGLTLSTYEHPRGWTRIDRLRRDGEVAAVERSWARYAVLAAAGVVALHYDHRAGTATVPRSVPLPRICARTLALCSGRTPTTSTRGGPARLVFSGVPLHVFEAAASKLGQQ